MPSALVQTEEHAEDLYDVIKAGDWRTAESDAAWFDTSRADLKAAVQPTGADTQPLEAAAGALKAAVTKHDRHGALIAVNRITHLAVELSAHFNPPVPVAVAELDYEGRELEIWAEANDSAKLAVTVGKIREAWAGVRSEVEAHGGTSQAREFDGLVKQLGAASTPDDYARLATQELDEVDVIERVFAH